MVLYLLTDFKLRNKPFIYTLKNLYVPLSLNYTLLSIDDFET